MSEQTILYYGPPGLEPSVLSAYFANLGVVCKAMRNTKVLLAETLGLPSPVIVLSGTIPRRELIDLLHQLRPDTTKPFPLVFILAPPEPFDAQDDGAPVMRGKSALRDTADRIMSSVFRSRYH